MGAKFNLNQLLDSGATKAEENRNTPQDTSRRSALRVVPLNINDLVPSKDNFYTMENIGELKNAIALFGVLQNLTVKPIGGGKYEIIAGHRRHRACMELVSEGKTEFSYVPCNIQTEKDELKEQILLIITNSTTRALSDWEKMKQAEELGKYFSALKKRDNLPGRVRDLVAEALQTSATQVARLNAIARNLSPVLTEEFKEGRLGVSAAYELSALPAEEQQEAAGELEAKGTLSINDVKERKQEPPKAVPPSDPDPKPQKNAETLPEFKEEQNIEPLALCPFCGSVAVMAEIEPHTHFIANMPDYEGGAFIECTGCTAAMSGKNRQEAADYWNRRIS